MSADPEDLKCRRLAQSENGRTGSAATGTHYKALTDKGIDPREQTAAQRAKVEAERVEAKRKGLTLGSVWPVYLQSRKTKWGNGHYHDHVRLASLKGKSGRYARARGPAPDAIRFNPRPL